MVWNSTVLYEGTSWNPTSRVPGCPGQVGPLTSHAHWVCSIPLLIKITTCTFTPQWKLSFFSHQTHKTNPFLWMGSVLMNQHFPAVSFENSWLSWARRLIPIIFHCSSEPMGNSEAVVCLLPPSQNSSAVTQNRVPSKHSPLQLSPTVTSFYSLA